VTNNCWRLLIIR